MVKKYVLLALLLSLIAIRCKETIYSGLDSLTDPKIKPKVIYTYPPMNSIGPYEDFNSYGYVYGYDQSIFVRFNKIMDRTSVMRAISISSSVGNALIDTSSVRSIGGDVFTFQVTDTNRSYYDNRLARAKLGESFMLAIAATAKDVNGNLLEGGFSTTFVPEPYFRVKYINPSNGAKDVLPYYRITLSFNSKIDTTLFSYIQIVPILSGRWYLYSDSTMIVYDQSSYDPDQTYTVMIPAGVHDKFGNTMNQGFRSTFTSATFRVMNGYPQYSNASLNTPITVEFSSAIDTGSVRTAFHIQPNIAGSFIFFTNNIYYTLAVELDEGRTYSVTIDTSARSKNGTRLSTPFSFSFTTDIFRVNWASPGNNQSDVPRDVDINISCDAYLDTSSIRSAFSVVPSVSGNFGYSEGSSNFIFMPHDSLLAYTEYTVTLGTSLRSKGEKNLHSPFVVKFTTGY